MGIGAGAGVKMLLQVAAVAAAVAVASGYVAPRHRRSVALRRREQSALMLRTRVKAVVEADDADDDTPLKAWEADDDDDDDDDDLDVDDGRAELIRPRVMPTMQELMRVVDRKLRSRQRAESRREAIAAAAAGTGVADGRKEVYLEKLEDLAGRREAAPLPEHRAAVVLGKALCRGRISVEHAARCSALARAVLDGRISPATIIFTPSAAGKRVGHRDDATVACTYFGRAGNGGTSYVTFGLGKGFRDHTCPKMSRNEWKLTERGAF